MHLTALPRPDRHRTARPLARPRPLVRRLLGAALALSGGLLAVGLPAAPAQAGHAPAVGAVDAVTASANGVRVSGWALDRDARGPLWVHVYVDGVPVAVRADKDRPDVAAAHRVGPRTGYNRFIRTAPGRHTVCVYAIGVGSGGNPSLGCRTATVENSTPIGAVDEVRATSDGVRVSGWAVDRDTAGSIPVHVYLDGAAVGTTADGPRPDVAAVLGRGQRSGFARTLPAGPGAHTVCVYAINDRPGHNPRLGCGTVTVGAAGSAPTPEAPTRTETTSGTGLRTGVGTPATGARNAWLHPFASTSLWNTAIGSGATFEPRTGARTASLLTAKPVINRTDWSVATRLARTSDPVATLTAVRNRTSMRIHIPSDTVATAGLDRHVTVVQPDGVTAVDMYKIRKQSNTRWTAEFVVVVDLRSSGTAAGVRASGMPGFAGLIRRHEVAAREIPHALAIAVPGSVLKRGPVWPATRQDGDAATSYTGRVPMGALFAIPPSVDVEAMRLSPEGRALARALQDYGAYVMDRSGTASLYCELSCDGAATERMKADFRSLFGHLRAVTNSSAGRVGGGGTPRVAPAPAL